MLTSSMQDYLKTIYRLAEAGEPATTSAVAERLSVSDASATNMLKKLAELKLVRYTPYHGVELSAPGRKVALEILRHHRLLELYLSQALGFSWDRVHEEAERLEHDISEEFEEKIAALLGQPSYDPHGDPIPTREGKVGPAVTQTLGEMPAVGRAGIVRRVGNDDPDRLRYFASLGLRPNVSFQVLERSPFQGPIRLRVGEREVTVGSELANQIYVSAAG